MKVIIKTIIVMMIPFYCVDLFGNENEVVLLKKALTIKNDQQKMELYDQILDMNNDCYQALFNRGILFIKRKEWLEAKIDLKKYISLITDNAKAYNNLGITYYHLKDYQKAYDFFDTAVGFDSLNIDFLKNKVRALLKLQKYLEALTVLNHASINLKNNAWVFLTKADIYKDLKQSENEVENLNLFLNKKPANFQVRYRRALLLLKNNQKNKAKHDLKYFVTKNIFFKKAYLRYALLEYEDGNYQNVEYPLEKWTIQNTGDLNSLEILLFVYQKNNKIKKAIQCCSMILKQDPTLTQYLFKKVLLQLKTGQLDIALKDINELTANHPNNVNYLFVKADIMIMQNKSESYLKILKKIINMEPENIKVRKKMIAFYLKREDYDSAVSQFDSLLKKDPGDISSYYHKGLCLLNLRQYNNAIDCFSKVLDLDDKHKESLLSRAELYLMLGKYQFAETDFLEIIKLYPQDFKSYLQLAKVEFYLNKVKESKIYYNKARQLDEKLPDFEYYFSDFQIER